MPLLWATTPAALCPFPSWTWIQLRGNAVWECWGTRCSHSAESQGALAERHKGESPAAGCLPVRLGNLSVRMLTSARMLTSSLLTFLWKQIGSRLTVETIVYFPLTSQVNVNWWENERGSRRRGGVCSKQSFRTPGSFCLMGPPPARQELKLFCVMDPLGSLVKLKGQPQNNMF